MSAPLSRRAVLALVPGLIVVAARPAHAARVTSSAILSFIVEITDAVTGEDVTIMGNVHVVTQVFAAAAGQMMDVQANLADVSAAGNVSGLQYVAFGAFKMKNLPFGDTDDIELDPCWRPTGSASAAEDQDFLLLLHLRFTETGQLDPDASKVTGPFR